MQRRSALKSLFLAVARGSFASADSQSTNAAPQPSLIDKPDNARIHFRDWGTGRTIVFVAPWGLCSDWWDIPVINLTERGWRCVTLDRRGHGRSDDPCRGYDFDTLSDDIAAFDRVVSVVEACYFWELFCADQFLECPRNGGRIYARMYIGPHLTNEPGQQPDIGSLVGD